MKIEEMNSKRERERMREKDRFEEDRGDVKGERENRNRKI